MLTKTQYTVDTNLFQEACNQLPTIDMKTPINVPTGNFFYDPWILKEEFKGTVWEKLYNTLPDPKGEARIINLKYGVCYQRHADIDDRYHLNLQGDVAYIINLDTDTMYRLRNDGHWYDLDASPRHSAVNFGYFERIQLVVRKLLIKNNISNPIGIVVKSNSIDSSKNRFLFDNNISTMLNNYNKNNIISNFKINNNEVHFNIDSTYIDELKANLPAELYIEENKDIL